MLDHEAVVNIALRAGEAILEVYNRSSAIQVTTKDDDSPLTEADIAAHEVIIVGRATSPKVIKVSMAEEAVIH